MTYSIKSDGLPRLDNYGEALKYWHNTKPWRGRLDNDPRPLNGNRKRLTQTIQLRENGDVACALYETNCIIYHPDNSITFTPYASLSTNTFVNRVAPLDFTAYYMNPIGPLLKLDKDDKFYSFRDTLTFAFIDKGYKLISESQPFKFYVLDEVKAKKVLKEHNYSDFRAWLRAYIAMQDILIVRSESITDIAAALKNFEFKLVYEKYGYTLYPASLLSWVRSVLYKKLGCITIEEIPYATSWNQVRAIWSSMRKYRHM